MVSFNELYIDSDGRLIIDVTLYPDNDNPTVRIDNILVHNLRTFNQDSLTTGALYDYKQHLHNTVIKGSRVRVIVDDLKVSSKDLLFVVVRISTGSGIKSEVNAVYDKQSYYKKMIELVHKFNNSCVVPKHLIDLLLRHKVFDLSIKTNDWQHAIEYWNDKFITNYNIFDCGCNG